MRQLWLMPFLLLPHPHTQPLLLLFKLLHPFSIHGRPRLGRIVTELRIAVRSRIANFHGLRFAVRGSLHLFELQTKCKKLTPIPKMSSSQTCSQRNSVQNAPVESSTALTATLFVKIPKFDHNPKKSHHHKVVRTEILCRMHRSRAPLLLWRPFS